MAAERCRESLKDLDEALKLVRRSFPADAPSRYYARAFQEIDNAQAGVEAVRMGLATDVLQTLKCTLISARKLFPNDAHFSSTVDAANLLLSGILQAEERI
jgi:hypothetical protein